MPTLRTTRLVLRPFQERDLEAVLSFHSRPDVARYVPWPPRDRQQVREAIAGYIAATRLKGDGDFLTFAVEQAETPGAIGQVLIRIESAEHNCGELGYVFDPSRHGHGFATEACSAVLDWAFQDAQAAPHRRPTRPPQRRLRAGPATARHAARGALHQQRVPEGRMDRRVRLRAARRRVPTSRGVDLPPSSGRSRSSAWPGRRAGRRRPRCRPTAGPGRRAPRARSRPRWRGSSGPGARSATRPRRATRRG